MIFKVCPYEEGDIFKLSVPDEAKGMFSYPGAEARWTAMTKIGKVGSIYGDGDLAAVVGIFWFYPHSAETWQVIGEPVRRSPWKYLMLLRELLEKQIEEHRYPVRVQAMVPSKWAMAGRFLECLGFEKEGTMRCFNYDSEDMEMWARVETWPK